MKIKNRTTVRSIIFVAWTLSLTGCVIGDLLSASMNTKRLTIHNMTHRSICRISICTNYDKPNLYNCGEDARDDVVNPIQPDGRGSFTIPAPSAYAKTLSYDLKIYDCETRQLLKELKKIDTSSSPIFVK